MSVVLASVSQKGHEKLEKGTRNVKKMEELPHKEKVDRLRLLHLYRVVQIVQNRRI